MMMEAGYFLPPCSYCTGIRGQRARVCERSRFTAEGGLSGL